MTNMLIVMVCSFILGMAAEWFIQDALRDRKRSIMKGEYTGADGHTYQWQRDGGQYRLRYMGISKVTNQHFDCWSNGIALPT